MAELTSPVITTQNVQTEVLDTNGNAFPKDNNLASIFDKIESGQKASDAIEEVMTNQPKSKDVKQVEVTKEDKKEEKKAEPSDLEQKLNETQKTKDDEEITRDGLKKAEEVKVENTEEKKEVVEDKKEEKDPDAPADDELQVLPHDKPKTAKRIQALLKKIDQANSVVATTRKEADERAAKLKELEAKLSEVKTVDPKTDEAVNKQLNELAMYRRRYDLEKDPEVKTKYDDRVANLDGQIPAILSKNRAGDGLLKLIAEEGGWLKFSQSNRQVPLDDGKIVPAAELADMIVKALPFADRKAIDSITLEQIQTKRDRERYFKEQETTANEFFKKRDEEAAAGSAAHQKQIKEATDLIQNWEKETVNKTEWLKEKEIPANATPEQKAAIEDDNRYTKQLHSLLKKSLTTKDIPGMLEVVHDSVAYYQQRRENSKLLAENKALKDAVTAKQAELDKFKSSSRTTSRAGSISQAATSATIKEKKPEGLEAALDAILSGKGDE